MVSGLAKAIGHLGHRLRPPLIRGPLNSNNILYNITFSSGKKKKDYKRPSPNPIRPWRPISHRGSFPTKRVKKKKKRKKKKITNGHHQIPSKPWRPVFHREKSWSDNVTWRLIPSGHHQIFSLQKKRLQTAEMFSLQKKRLQKVEKRHK